ncbi:hypothetical protein FAZ15_01560 [Sphingobacterium olei]|uniref:Uncharacterized protein n=1 Tax=Sphingobacterium olei TaxID=2571155 RepID=A0A4U0P895_9SPHI|nr:hypothetical protein [Sphingobacterium olei]TJZ63012.1 hypothetical protein FAZ15_01560 [Sphingobacterium olei]
MLKTLKKNAMALAALAIAVSASAYNVADKFTTAQSGWYTVTPDPDDHDNQNSQIIGSFVSETPPVGNCSPEVLPAEKPCQILLDLSLFSQTTPTGMNVAEAVNTYDAIIDEANSGGNEDGYARTEPE